MDAFTISWNSLYFYAFPPFCQIGRYLQKILKEQVPQGIVILPLSPTQVWWPQLLKMLISIPSVLPKQDYLLSLSHSPRTLHPLRRKLTMLACLLSGNPSRIEEFQRQLLKLIMASWRDGTKKKYSTYITKWQTFCNQRRISHFQPSVVSVLDFLTLLYQRGLTYSAINTARSALSGYITLENGACAEKHPLVSRLMKGIFQEKPPRPKYKEIWDVSIVLSYLQSLSPVDKLPLKELTLKLVLLILLVSGQRGQTVHLLSIDHMVSVNSCYTFQIVDHLKQGRPGVKNPLVELRPLLSQH